MTTLVEKITQKIRSNGAFTSYFQGFHKILYHNSVIIRDLIIFICDECAWRDLWRTVMNIRGWMQMCSTPFDLFSWNKHGIKIYMINNTWIHWQGSFNNAHSVHTGSSSSRLALLSFSACSMLPPSLVGLDCLSRSLSRGPALLRPLPLGWPQFPQVPGNALPPCRAQWVP